MAKPDELHENSEPLDVQIRLWPAILIALVHIAALVYALGFTHTLLQFFVGALIIPSFLLIGLTVWWMLCRRIPMKQRLAGLLILIVVLAWIILTHPLMTGGIPFLIVVLPIITIGTAGVFVLSVNQPWSRRRVALITLMIGTALVLTAVRVDGTHGDEMPAMSWRWSPTSEELAEASFIADAQTNRIAAVSAQADPNDWPSFRGPDRDGRATGITFATNWSDEAPRELWRQRIGIGWSSFTVIGDYFFTQEQRGDAELVVCYEVATGDEVWINSLPVRFDESHGGGPRATPTFHEGNLLVMGAMGALQCIQGTTGETVWKRELTDDADVEVPMWGFSSSPLVVDGLVVVFAGGADGKSVLAYDLQSGDPVWQAGDAAHSYSSVHFATIDDIPQLLVPSNFGIQSFAPGSGKLLWQFEKATPIDDPACIQPLMPDSNTVLLSSEVIGTQRLEVHHTDADCTVEQGWANKKFRPSFHDAVIHEGFAYGFDGRLFVCIDTATGDRRWKSKRHGGQVLLLPDMNALLVLTDKGDVILIEATPEAYREIGRFKALNGKTWNHPVIADGKLFVRNSEEVACYQLPG